MVLSRFTTNASKIKTIAIQACTILNPASCSAISIPTDLTIQKVTVQIQNAGTRREFNMFLSLQLPIKTFTTAAAARRKIHATNTLQILSPLEISLSLRRL